MSVNRREVWLSAGKKIRIGKDDEILIHVRKIKKNGAVTLGIKAPKRMTITAIKSKV